MKFIAAHPELDSARTLARLVRALESDDKCELAELYRLDYEHFDLGVEVLKEWRIDRYYMGKAKVHELSMPVAEPLH